ncbi:MAG TPA: DUF6541 family protein [Candidatus Angelobacter sp.]|jgi:hypothetical protein|nr:DUF6541 family protein [Candidatus Angelobacter sp.]
MDLLDLLRALPGLLLLGLVPGLALLALVRPSMPAWWRLAAAPGLSIGAVGVLGLVYHRAHLAFELKTVLPAVAVLAAVAIVVRLRARAGPPPRDPAPSLRTRPARIVLGTALAAGLLSASIAVVAFRAGPLPPDGDNPIHAYITRTIAAEHDVVVAQPVPAVGSTAVRDRVAFEATSAEVAAITGMRPDAAMLPLVLLCVVLLPLSLAMLALEATGNWMMAAAVPLLGAGFTMIPWALGYGEFPYLADATLVVPLALSARRALLGSERTRNLLLVTACVAAMWVTHGLEFVTALAIGVPFVLASLRGRPLRRLVTGAIGTGVAVLAGAALVTVLTPHPAIPAAVLPAGVAGSYSQSAQMLARMGTRSQMLHALSDFARSELVAPAVLLYVLGLAASLLVRGVRWVLVTHLLLLLVLADVGYGGILMRVWTPVFPWSGADRVVSIQWFVVPLLMAWGMFNAPLVLRPILARARSRRAVLGVMGAVGAVALLVPVFSAWRTLTDMQASVAGATHTGDADVQALAAMDRALPPGTLVLTDTGADGGQWIDVLTRDVEWAPLAFTRGFVRAGGVEPAVDPRVAALAAACHDPAAARAALNGIGAVFVGSMPDPAVATHWDTACIAALPGVHQAARASMDGRTATVFTIDPSLQAQSSGG